VDGFINWEYYSKIGVSISGSSTQKETMKNRQTFYSQSNDRPTEEESDDESSEQTSTMDKPPDLFIPDGPPSLDIPGGVSIPLPSKPSMDVWPNVN
jgi:hypothetical protein